MRHRSNNQRRNHRLKDGHVAWIIGRVLTALVCLLIASGCRIYPEHKKKSINELYFEALAASQKTPENTLGLNPAAGPAQAGLKTFPASHELLTPTPGTPDTVPPVPRPESFQAVPEFSERQSPVTVDPQVLKSLPEIPASQVPNAGWRRAGASIAEGSVRTVSHKARSTTVTEIFEDTDVRQALQSLAQQADVDLILDERVNGVASAVIEDEPFESALRKVLLPLGLVYRRTDKGEYIVASPDPDSPLFPLIAERFEYRPTHLGPEELLRLVPDRESQYLTVIEKRNLIVVEAPREMASPILQRLQDSDTPIPQVELEAIVCVIAPERGFRSGLDWGHAVTLNGSDMFRIGMTGLAFSGVGSGTGLGDSFSSFAVTSTFVKLLAEEGYLSIRAAPRVTARDGEQASISITRQSFFSTQPVNANQFFRQEIEQVEAGIQLEITPVIRGNNITVRIEKAEVSEDIRTADVNSQIANNPFPLINRRTVSTTVHVKDGETIVIGGLVQRQVVDRLARIPVLGSIPGIGRMFQTVEQTEHDAEVVIFISPRIVGDTPACGVCEPGLQTSMAVDETGLMSPVPTSPVRGDSFQLQ
ncbi:MAG: hypothetical protein KDA91_13160 [Planctomycetaceae bacterium]|nr:hypothetical protein [Planctomycetaceae bacterium]